MWRALLISLLLAGCITPLPPTPQDLEAKKFEPAAGQSVIYLFRQPAINREAATLWLDDRVMGSTYSGTYFRWVVPPGRHRIAGYAGDAGSIMIDTAPGRIYFVEQIYSNGFMLSRQSYFRLVDENYGRAAVMQSQLVG
jgi:uncharacterized protein DUF2846